MPIHSMAVGSCGPKRSLQGNPRERITDSQRARLTKDQRPIPGPTCSPARLLACSRPDSPIDRGRAERSDSECLFELLNFGFADHVEPLQSLGRLDMCLDHGLGQGLNFGGQTAVSQFG